MNTSLRRTTLVAVTLLALAFSALGVTPAFAAITISNGMSASLVLGQPNFTSGAQGSGTTGMQMPSTLGRKYPES